MIRTSLRRLAAPSAVALSLAFALAACGGESGASTEGLSGDVKIDGSSTVFPLSNAATEFFKEDGAPDVNVTVGQSGTGGGFEAFCTGKTDISDASRPIKDDEEAPVCAENKVEYTELQVATDALTVVVHPDTPIDCITTEQLKKIWEPGAQGKVTNWNQVDPSFPDAELALFGPGTDSGTFDYFTDEINGEEGASRSDYEASEEDNVIVEGVANTPGGLGYFGYTYFEENADQLKALEVDSGDGCVAPSVETAQDGSYTPLARPLFIYVSNTAYGDKEQVAGFVDYYVENLTEIAEEAKFIALNDEQLAETNSQLDSLGG
ncbi:MAG: phosphate ABC transporter substrate-binding protein PstS family protein [Propionibacteriales bacterium]|nr:phosphate ABC transporter substrate-binding protein PstS family protein [Propionibacteriales bacterium]